MHFSRLITAIVLVAVTGVIASSPTHEDNEKIVDVRRRESTLAAEAVDTAGMDTTPGCDNPEADKSGMYDYSDSMEEDNVSPAMSSLELSLWRSRKMICVFGRCLRRHSRRRKCPRGYSVVAYRRCGWRRRRAVCCRGIRTFRRRRHHWANDKMDAEAEGEDIGEDEDIEPAEKLDQMD